MRAAVVLHVPYSPHSSVVIGYDRLARRMAARGHTLEIVPPDAIRPGLNPRLHPIVLPLLVRRWLAHRTDLDLVIFHSYTGWLAARPRAATRIVTAFHGFEPLFHEALAAETRRRGGSLTARYALMYGTLMPHMLRRACRRSDLVLCLNDDERHALVEGGYAPASKIALGWHDAPSAFFQPHTYRDRATTVLCVMQWLPTKGTAYLVDAFSSLAAAHPDLRLVVAGSLVSEEDVCREFPEALRSRVSVHPTFDPAQHRALLAGADIFVHASLSEGFSRAVIEAMASGLPVVTTRTGFAVDRLTDGVDARIVPVADAAALARAAGALIDDRAAREALGLAAQAHASRLRAADGTSAQIALFEQLVAAAA